MNKKNILIAVLAIIIYILAQQQGPSVPDSTPSGADSFQTTVQGAFEKQLTDLQIQGQGVVKKVLPDDRKGLQHQKFILETSPGQTVLVAHNIDIATMVRLMFVVGGSMFIAMSFAAFNGTMLPIVLNQLKIDPAVATGPFVSTGNDLSASLIYLTMCSLLLN